MVVCGSGVGRKGHSSFAWLFVTRGCMKPTATLHGGFDACTLWVMGAVLPYPCLTMNPRAPLSVSPVSRGVGWGVGTLEARNVGPRCPSSRACTPVFRSHSVACLVNVTNHTRPSDLPRQTNDSQENQSSMRPAELSAGNDARTRDWRKDGSRFAA